MSYYNYKKAKELRKMNNLSLSEMGEILGKDKSFLSRIENGKKKPNIELIMRISSIFNVSLNELIMEEKTMNMTEKYFLNFKRETISEIGANLEGDIYNYCRKLNVNLDDDQDPMTVLYNQVFDMHHNKLYKTDSKKDLDEIEYYFKGVTTYMHNLQKANVAAGI